MSTGFAHMFSVPDKETAFSSQKSRLNLAKISIVHKNNAIRYLS